LNVQSRKSRQGQASRSPNASSLRNSVVLVLTSPVASGAKFWLATACNARLQRPTASVARLAPSSSWITNAHGHAAARIHPTTCASCVPVTTRSTPSNASALPRCKTRSHNAENEPARLMRQAGTNLAPRRVVELRRKTAWPSAPIPVTTRSTPSNASALPRCKTRSRNAESEPARLMREAETNPEPSSSAENSVALEPPIPRQTSSTPSNASAPPRAPSRNKSRSTASRRAPPRSTTALRPPIVREVGKYARVEASCVSEGGTASCDDVLSSLFRAHAE
jgi:hypothetical protein